MKPFPSYLRFALPIRVCLLLVAMAIAFAQLPVNGHAEATIEPVAVWQDVDAAQAAQQERKPLVAPPPKLIADEKLEAALREAVYEKRGTTERLTEDDLRKVFVLEADGKGIADLRGLEFCRNLHLLKLSNNSVSDLSPLAGLPRLQSLDLEGNEIADITPLAQNTALQYLVLGDNQVSDLSPLSGLTNLSALMLANNQVSDLAPLSGLTKLASLYINQNSVKDISPLKDLTMLSSLDLTGNAVGNVVGLDGMRNLRYLIMEDNQLSDLAGLVKFVEADAAGSRRVAPFLHVYLGGNPLSDEAKTTQLEALRQAGVRVHEKHFRDEANGNGQ